MARRAAVSAVFAAMLVSCGPPARTESPRTEVSPDVLAALRGAGSPPNAVGGGPQAAGARDETISGLARARCEHLQSCRRVGAGLAYDTFEACMRAQRRELIEALPVAACANIAGAECFWALRTAPCTVDSEPRACEPNAMCRADGA